MARCIRRMGRLTKEKEEDILKTYDQIKSYKKTAEVQKVNWQTVKKLVEKRREHRLQEEAAKLTNSSSGGNVPNAGAPSRPFAEYGQLGPKWEGKTEGEIQAECFRLFQGDVKPFVVTRDLGLPQQLVMKVFRQFLEAAGHTTVYCDLSYDKGRKDQLQDSHRRLYIFKFPCDVCGEPMEFDPRSQMDRDKIREMMRKGGVGNWGHSSCHESQAKS